LRWQRRWCNYFAAKRWQSSTAQWHKPSHNIYLAEAEACPSQHNETHIGQYYPLPHTFSSGSSDGAATRQLFPEGFAGTLDDEFSCTNAQHLMIRRPATELFELFRRRLESPHSGDRLRDPRSVCRRLLLGPKGSGKSATLQHVVHHCRVNGWLASLPPASHLPSN